MARRASATQSKNSTKGRWLSTTVLAIAVAGISLAIAVLPHLPHPWNVRDSGAALQDSRQDNPPTAPRKAAPPAAKPGEREAAREPVDEGTSAGAMQVSLRRAQELAAGGARPSCVDASPNCEAWAAAGECQRNPEYMQRSCPAACGRCAAEESRKETWVLPEAPAGLDWAKLTTATGPAEDYKAACEGAASFLSERTIPGLHVLCRLPPTPTQGQALTRLAAWRDANAGDDRRGPPSHDLLVPLPAADGAVPPPLPMAALINALAAMLALEWRGERWQPPAFYTCMGDKLVSPKSLARALVAGPVCFFEGGQFLWPPGLVGTEREITLLDGRTTKITTLSIVPIVLSIDNFLLPDEADHIIDRASPHLKKSGVALKDVDRGKAAKEFRTSSQYFLRTDDGDKVLHDIDARAQWVTRIPLTHAEYIQVLRYERMEHYRCQRRPPRRGHRGLLS